MGLGAEPLAQPAPDLAQADAGVGDLDLHVARPVVLVAARGPGGVGLGLHRRELVEELGRHHLAGEAALGEVGRHAEGLDHQAMVLVRLPGHDRDHPDQGYGDQGGHHLQPCLDAVAEAAPAQA